MLRAVNRRVLLPVAGLLLVIGLFGIFYPFNKVDAECAKPGEVSSGFVDDSGCPVTIESYQRITDEEARFKIERVAGLGAVMAALAVGGVAIARKGGGRAQPPAAVN